MKRDFYLKQVKALYLVTFLCIIILALFFTYEAGYMDNFINTYILNINNNNNNNNNNNGTSANTEEPTENNEEPPAVITAVDYYNPIYNTISDGYSIEINITDNTNYCDYFIYNNTLRVIIASNYNYNNNNIAADNYISVLDYNLISKTMSAFTISASYKYSYIASSYGYNSIIIVTSNEENTVIYSLEDVATPIFYGLPATSSIIHIGNNKIIIAATHKDSLSFNYFNNNLIYLNSTIIPYTENSELTSILPTLTDSLIVTTHKNNLYTINLISSDNKILSNIDIYNVKSIYPIMIDGLYHIAILNDNEELNQSIYDMQFNLISRFYYTSSSFITAHASYVFTTDDNYTYVYNNNTLYDTMENNIKDYYIYTKYNKMVLIDKVNSAFINLYSFNDKNMSYKNISDITYNAEIIMIHAVKDIYIASYELNEDIKVFKVYCITSN